jgi:Acyl-coenzyme A synthetases/AMP-(fatty) acid ligases
LLPNRRFLLMGRADRCVKILERMVSLPEIDAALSAHPLVDQAYSASSLESIPRVWTLLTLFPEGKSWLKQHTYRELRQSLIAFIAPKVENFARPRRIRVVEELPYTVQGKLPEAAVRPLLASCWQEPVVEVVERGPDKYVADLTFIPDAVYFQGHFPGQPILPGVTQLMVIQLMLRRHFRIEPSAGNLTRLKFMKIITPLQQVRLKIVRRANGSFDFSIDSEVGTHASGTFTECRE